MTKPTKKGKGNVRNGITWLQKLKHFITSNEKPKKEKVIKPKTHVFRKLGAIVFWLLFLFMFLVVMVSITSKPPSPKAKVAEKEITVNPATKPEAVQFAQNFIRDYYTWSNDSEGWEERSDRLYFFIAKGLDEQAGLIKESVAWDAVYKNSAIKQIEEIDSNSAHMTFKVWAEMSREVENEVEVEKEDEEGKKKKVNELKSETETKALVKFLVVPVTFNGNTYGVYELPSITYIDEATDVQMQQVSNYTSEKDGNEIRQISNFLNTFFASYAEDDKERLSYILTDKENPNGMNGAMNFVEVKEVDVYEGDSEDENHVISKVTFEDPELKTQINSLYHLTVTKEKEHYVVSEINTKKND
ncbi:conjugal transfer protein [Oceanobacillus damuensis]|uniref:conjugal transfer protein n=1 Tax=Oceanobacillus damuensis TaxID=937928 RepID=UPI00083531CD|nr:conjugal transfer protein [Oceanobacillus damuensis]